MEKKKIFFVVSSLGAGGSERVFWLLSQGFDKKIYDVYIVLFDSRKNFLSTQLPGVNIIDLKTIRASKSFFKLYKLIKKEKPYAVFSTAAHLNLLVAIISFFTPIPKMIARESNIYTEMAVFGGNRTKFWGLFVNFFYKQFNTIVCQSDEMQQSFIKRFTIGTNKLVIIPNPVINIGQYEKTNSAEDKKRIIIVARLAHEKSHNRLIEIFSKLPDNYYLTIAGDGPCKDDIVAQINDLGIQQRVDMLGQVSHVNELIAKHDVFVLTSRTEGFPNAALESLASGTPVVSFKVGGIANLIKPDFNGYIVEQDDLEEFRNCLIKACSKKWESNSIRQDIENRFSLNTVTKAYESLIY